MDTHTMTGNCLRATFACPDCGSGEFCDVCHKHEEPRGGCEECPPCSGCQKDADVSDV